LLEHNFNGDLPYLNEPFGALGLKTAKYLGALAQSYAGSLRMRDEESSQADTDRSRSALERNSAKEGISKIFEDVVSKELPAAVLER
jgi:hypothetical protein